jgi:hypothetical protein
MDSCVSWSLWFVAIENWDTFSEGAYVSFSLILSFLVGYFAMLLETELQSVGWQGDWWIRKDLKESGRNLIEVLSWNLCGGLRKPTRYLSQDSRCPHRYLNLVSPDYNSRELQLDWSVWASLCQSSWLASVLIVTRIQKLCRDVFISLS